MDFKISIKIGLNFNLLWEYFTAEISTFAAMSTMDSADS